MMVVLFFWATSPVITTPCFESEYFKKSLALTDSLKKNSFAVEDSLQAGFAKVSITPGLLSQVENISEDQFKQVPLAGYGARKGAPATGVHDSIFVKAAALEVGPQLIIFVTADLLIIPPNITDSVVHLLAGKGFRREQLFLAATHTHSSLGGWGPGFVAKQFAGEENKNLEKWLTLKISKAVIQAVDDLKPAKIASGNFKAASFTRNRLVGEIGTKNNDFSFIYLEQINDKKAVIGSFAAHSTTLGDENMEISADYPGYWARKMENTSVDYALFFAGSMGSQSPVSKGEGFDKPKFLGEALADSLNNYLPAVEPAAKTVLFPVTLKLPLPEYHIRLSRHRNLSTFLSKKLMPLPENPCLQAIRLGKTVWITTPSDFSGEYALQIKNQLTAEGFDSNVTSFNGSYLGYIIPGKYFYLDKYEPKEMGWFGPYMGDYTIDIIRRISETVIQNKLSK
jgi:hypothetical protein